MNSPLLLSFSLFLCLSVSILDKVSASNQYHRLVFEEVGQVASSVSYLHVTIPLNMTGLQAKVRQYSKLTNQTFSNVYAPTVMSEGHCNEIYYFDRFFQQQMKRFADGFRQLGDEYKTRHKGLLSRIQHLYNIMPFVAPPPTDAYQGQFHLHFKRFLPFALARGIFGTFMGLYNQYKYGQLQSQGREQIRKIQRHFGRPLIFCPQYSIDFPHLRRYKINAH